MYSFLVYYLKKLAIVAAGSLVTAGIFQLALTPETFNAVLSWQDRQLTALANLSPTRLLDHAIFYWNGNAYASFLVRPFSTLLDFFSSPPESWTSEGWIFALEIGAAIALVCMSSVGERLSRTGPFAIPLGSACVLTVAAILNVAFYYFYLTALLITYPVVKLGALALTGAAALTGFHAIVRELLEDTGKKVVEDSVEAGLKKIAGASEPKDK